jgi:predicted MPP superfamily phosphohydrolase
VSIINAQLIHTRTVEIPSFGKEMRAVLLSDIHVGTIWDSDRLQKIVEITNSLRPDVIFITGDIVSGGAILQEDTFASLSDLGAKTFFVHGNHEHYEGIEEVDKALYESGVRVLVDEKVEFGGIEIVGLGYDRNENHKISVLDKMHLSENKPSILLSHVPINPTNDAVNLILAGHTHAGQIFPFNFFIRLRHKYVRGKHTLGNSTLYVSPGTGTWGPPMRLGSRNEITLLLLK